MEHEGAIKAVAADEKTAKESSIDASRRFYENHVAGMIKSGFAQYGNRIAVGIAGEGSDCFGYDDLISRDHDFGTGVCLWLTDEDMELFGTELKTSYDALYDSYMEEHPQAVLTERLRARRGVMSIHDYYSNILGTDCDTANCRIDDETWQMIDHDCLATAVNGEVFRDDAGVFTAFRELLIKYYPDHIWKIRIANELHRFSSAMQVNYARCMYRGDVVAARLCHAEGIESAMQLYFLMKREYPPYYKWTFRRLEEIDKAESGNVYSELIRVFSGLECDLSAWEGKTYSPNELNTSDRMVKITEQIAARIVTMMKSRGFTRRSDPYLERYVDEVLL